MNLQIFVFPWQTFMTALKRFSIFTTWSISPIRQNFPILQLKHLSFGDSFEQPEVSQLYTPT